MNTSISHRGLAYFLFLLALAVSFFSLTSAALVLNISGYKLVKLDLKPTVIEVCTPKEAMAWWTGSTDLTAQRSALCFNVAKSNKGLK